VANILEPAQWLDGVSPDYFVHGGGELPMVVRHPRRPQDVAVVLGTAQWPEAPFRAFLAILI